MMLAHSWKFMENIKVLFVCMGNICRSPTAEGVFSHLVAEKGLQDRVFIDSAGTTSYHIGEPPDRRATKAAMARGIDLSKQRSRVVALHDFDDFDMVLAMDNTNLANLLKQRDDDSKAVVDLLLNYGVSQGVKEVPDPYYGGSNGFEYVIDLIQNASEGLLDHIILNYLTDK